MPTPFISRPTAGLAELFADPPAAFSPVPIWWWSGAPLDAARLREQMEQLIAGGIRQAVVLNLAPSGPLYGSLADDPAFFTAAWWSLFRGVCRDAQELGFSLWFYDQLGFSGADVQGRLVQREPACRGQSLDHLTVDVDGAATVRCPAGAEPLAAFALPREGGPPLRVEVAGGTAAWSGRGRLMLVFSCGYGFDYLDPRACELLIDCVHGEFERQVGDHLGSTIVGSFQDELPSMPTWSAGFAEQFRRRRGYDLIPQLASLWGAGDGAVRADYQRTRAELAEEAFFRPLAEWHSARGLAAGCDQQHPARAGYPLEATQQYADYLRTHRWFSAPGSDHWGEAKVHSSLAHLYGHPRTWVEAFHTTGWGGTLEETFDWLLPWLRAGATLYNPHAVYYATVGGRWEWAAPSTCWRQPYWRHYPLFATAVSRLCAALSWGEHVCDVGVLFPTRTIQHELQLDLEEVLLGQPAGTSAAHDAYLDLVGRMHWFEPQPGVLDRDGRDFDVLDDDSVVRGTVRDGCLRIGREAYGVLVLPGCSHLEQQTVAALRGFAAGGGLLIAVGAVPPELSDVVRAVRHASELPSVLEDVPRRVTAPVPTLLRSDGESAALLVVGASPSATLQPPERAWRTEGYTFDAGRYARSVEVTVRGVAEPVALWEPGCASATPLPAVRVGDGLRVEVPLTDGPCALVVFGPAARSVLEPVLGEVAMARPPAATAGPRLPLDDWTGELLPTSENRWGDFATPPAVGPVPYQVWHLEQQDTSGGWQRVRATYAARGQVRRGEGDWEPVVWSERFGSPVDEDEPRGYVPEEFLDLGEVAAGEQVDLRFRVCAEADSEAVLVVGSTADKQIRWNGEQVRGAASVYYDRAPVAVQDGENVLELTLTSPTARRLRASFVLRPEPEELPRPEWVSGELLAQQVQLDTVPEEAILQLGTLGRVTLHVNGEVFARHGEFDNYGHVRQPRVRRYDLRDQLVVGRNEFLLELHEPEAAAVVDAFLDRLCLVTNGSWRGSPRGLAQVPHDPRWVQLRPRPHPLPAAEGEPVARQVGRLLPATPAPRSTTFRIALPPGAAALRLPLTAGGRVLVEGRPLPLVAGAHRLARPAPAGTLAHVQVLDAATAWDGPVEVELAGGAPLPLGDWSELGLRGWSGGVRYRSTVAGPLGARALDLGRVRGTAELRVNGVRAGCRIWAPYSFDVAGLFDREQNVVEVDVYNTLAPFVDAVSTSPWVLPGQTVSGLLGPVTLVTGDDALCDHDSVHRSSQGVL